MESKWLCSQNDSEGTFQHIRSEKQSARLHLPNWNSEAAQIFRAQGFGKISRFAGDCVEAEREQSFCMENILGELNTMKSSLFVATEMDVTLFSVFSLLMI